MFPDQVIIDAMHVPYVDAYWTEQEEREQGPPMQAELADITEPGPPDELLALGKKWLQRITDHWHVSAHTVRVGRRPGPTLPTLHGLPWSRDRPGRRSGRR
jgi:hypothetical protein